MFDYYASNILFELFVVITMVLVDLINPGICHHQKPGYYNKGWEGNTSTGTANRGEDLGVQSIFYRVGKRIRYDVIHKKT